MQTPMIHAHRIFKERHGTLRTFEALRAGIHPRTLYALRDRGEIEQIARGLFRLAELPPPSEPDLLTVAKKVPKAVFCLLTALAFHRLTTQVPHAVEVALPRTARLPRLGYPPLKGFSVFFRIATCRYRNSYCRWRSHPGLLSRKDACRSLQVSKQGRPRCRA